METMLVSSRSALIASGSGRRLVTDLADHRKERVNFSRIAVVGGFELTDRRLHARKGPCLRGQIRRIDNLRHTSSLADPARGVNSASPKSPAPASLVFHRPPRRGLISPSLAR